MYTERFYRSWVQRDDLVRFELTIGESDLLILCNRALQDLATEALREVRAQIEEYIARVPAFRHALGPLPVPAGVPPVVAAMAAAAEPWNVGPMAAVAGAVAEQVGRRLATESETVVVENGGDVFVKAPDPVRFALYAGASSPFGDRIAFEVNAKSGRGVCTSSGVVGPSLSMGCADAVVAIAADAACADAAATSIANQIQTPADIARIVASEKKRGALSGLIACAEDKLGVFGDVRLVKRQARAASSSANNAPSYAGEHYGSEDL